MKVKCAEFLTNVFISINKNIGAASAVIKRKKKYVHLPHLFGQDAVKYKVLPLGFNACQEPNQDCICDLKSCTVTNDEEPWKVFSGCWHSFHDKCLNGSPFCPICQKLLENKTKELAATAKEAIFNTTPISSTNETNIEPDDEIPMAETLPSKNSHNCDETIKGLHTTIEGLMPSPKPIYHHQQSKASGTLGAHIASSKQPQSSLIDHQPQSSLIDHQTQSSSTDSQPQSSSIDHQTQSSSNDRQPLKEIQNTYQTQHQQPPVSGFSTRFLPWDICQTNITGRPMASNACTIIASLWCRKFLKKNITISACQYGEFDDIANSYKQTILTGNMLYNSFNLPAHQPNLEVCNVVRRIPDLTLKILNDVGFFDVNHLRQAFIQMLQDGCRHAGVLIIPPANSVAVLIESQQIALFDSHQHGNNGGLVLLCNLEKFEQMLNYLGESQNLCGSNFAELGLTK